MRMTKIICTIGPASDTPEVFKQMCLAGMNVARLNFSHGTHEEHQKKIDMIKAVREELKMPIAIMLDTKGPEYRIKTFKDDSVTLSDGDTFTFYGEEREGDERDRPTARRGGDYGLVDFAASASSLTISLLSRIRLTSLLPIRLGATKISRIAMTRA